MFVTSNLCIPVRSILGWSAVVSCEGELILFYKTEFPVVYYLVRAVYNKIDSRLLTKWKPNKWRAVESNRNSCFWQAIFSLQPSLIDKGPPNHPVKAKALLLRNDQYKSYGKSFSACVEDNVRLAERKQSACSSSSWVRDCIHLLTCSFFRSQ
jgi:hypothetical protein